MKSNFSKFKRGDKVKTAHGRIGKVIGTYKSDGDFMVHVEMDSTFRDDFKEDDLKFYHPDIEHRKQIGAEHIGDKCPKCNTPWTKTSFGTRKWKDCLVCKKTAEEILDHNTRLTVKTDLDDDVDDMDDFAKDWYKIMADWGTD